MDYEARIVKVEAGVQFLQVSAEQIHREFERYRQENAAEHQALSDRIEMQREHFDAALAAQRDHFDTAIAAQRDHFDTAIAAQRDHFDAKLAAQADRFDGAMAAQREYVERALESQRRFTEQALQELRTSMDIKFRWLTGAVIANFVATISLLARTL